MMDSVSYGVLRELNVSLPCQGAILTINRELGQIVNNFGSQGLEGLNKFNILSQISNQILRFTFFCKHGLLFLINIVPENIDVTVAIGTALFVRCT